MVKLLEIHDLPDTGQLQLLLNDANEDSGTQSAPPVEFRNPLDDSDRAEIAWYFQEYLDNPFGPAKSRAEAVETGLRNLGRLLFELVFGGNDAARELFATAQGEGLSGCQLAVISPRSDFLALPWELLNEPNSGYLASGLASIVRRIDTSELPAFAESLTNEQLNVLLVSPLPEGSEASVSAGLADAAVKVLESLDAQVELDYLRPPTFEALTRLLNDKPGHYHLVHLDGLLLSEGSGDIVFEASESAPSPIPARQVADILVNAQVPVALLTAGDRGRRQAGNTTSWTELGSKMCQSGIPLTILIPHYLHGSAIGEGFLRRFYLAMTQGQDVATAVAQARPA